MIKLQSKVSTCYSINGKLVPEEQAVVPVTDRGFLYGDGVFETIHAYGTTPFRLGMHLDRLERGFEAMGFQQRPDRKTLGRWVRAAIREGGFPEANVRLTVTRGSGPRGPSIRGVYEPFTLITVTHYNRRPERDYTAGVSAVMASFRRQESSVIASLKTTAYIEQIFARRAADEQGADEALLLNNSGLLCEGSSSNLTLVRNGGLVAPDPKIAGALPGTMQLIAFELAKVNRIPVRMVGLGPWDLRDCDEAFLTGSMREFTPLVKVDGHTVGSGKPGPITRQLIQVYRKKVESECKGFRFKKR